jgi:hypothetical protein
MNEALLSVVIQKTRGEIQAFGYNQSTMKHYERYWKYLSIYFSEHGYKMYSEQLCDQYVSAMKNKLDVGIISKSTYKIARRSIYLVKDCFKNGSLEWHRFLNKSRRIKEVAFIEILAVYESQLQKEQKSEGTVRR